MSPDELRQRTRSYGLRVIRLVEAPPSGRTADVIGRQLLRCGTSVGANYRAAARAKSPADFVSKMKIVEEEADESLYWMELLNESGLVPQERTAALMAEGQELLAIAVSSIETARSRLFS